MLAALVAVYAAAGFWLVPRVLRSQAADFAQEKYGRKLTLGEIRFNPFTFELVVDGFSFPDADGQPLARFDKLRVNFELESIFRAGASFKEISVDRPYARVLIRESGELNLADLVKPFPEQPEPKEPEEPPRLFIDHFQVSGGHISFTDRTLPTPYTNDLTPLDLELRDFSTTPSTGNAYDLHAEAGSGASLDWSGNFAWNPLASRGRFKFANIEMTRHAGYIRQAAGFDVTSGRIGFEGDYDLSVAKAGTQFKANLHTLGVDDLGIRAAGEEAETLHFTKLGLTHASFDLAKRNAAIEKVLVTGGSVLAWRDADGNVNLTALGNKEGDEPPAAPSTPAAGPDQASPFLFSAPDIELQGLVVAVEDRQAEPAIKLMLDPFDLKVTGYSTAPGTTIGIVTDAKVDKAGALSTDLRYALDDGQLEGKASLTDFDLTVIQPYLDRYTRMDLLDGRLTTELAVKLLADGGFAADGLVQLDRLRAVDKAGQQDFLKWQQLRAEGFSYDGRTARLHVKHLKARAPYARVIIAKDQTVNITEILTPAKPAPAYQPTVQVAVPGGPPPQETQVRIDHVAVENGSLNFTDFWIQPNYAVSIQGLNGSVTGLSSDPQSRARLDLEGKVDRYAPATIDGEMNLLSAALFTNIRIKFAGVDMTSVTPYSGRFAGYKIEKGKLSVDVTYHVENRQLDAQQKFVVDQLQLGEKVESPDAVSLPLKLAVALLKDRNGVIDLDLPVSGSLDDPKFRLGPIIWKAFVGLLTKIATAPFALIGKLFGGGPEVNFVEFDAGATALDPAGQEKMTGVRKALVERPSLQVDVPMAYSADLDGTLLARGELDKSLAALAGSKRGLFGRPKPDAVAEMLTDPENRFDLLAEQYRAEAGKDAPLPGSAAAFEALKKKERTPELLASANKDIEDAWLEKHPATTEQLEALGKSRAQSIQDALLGGGEVDPGRVFLIHAESQAPGAEKVKLEISLK